MIYCCLSQNTVMWMSHFALFLAISCAFRFTEGKRSSKLPNILLMLADDLGWYDVGFHNPKIQTPHIDKLAKDGVILDNYYVQPVCTPTRGALMTGRYPIHTGMESSCSCSQSGHNVQRQGVKGGGGVQRRNHSTQVGSIFIMGNFLFVLPVNISNNVTQ